MFRVMFVNLIIFGMMSIQIPITAPQTSNVLAAGTSLYFPFIFNNSGIKLIVTTFNNCPDYCYWYYALGYIENVGNQSYTVTLEANVEVYPFPDPGGTPTPPYSYTEEFTPAFEVTLPGQINPFSFEGWSYKTVEVVTDIYVKDLKPVAAGNYYPLTIQEWDYEDPVLSGMARNDSDQTLYNARIVVAGLDECSWVEASLNDVTLDPGQQTEFSVTYYSGCINENLSIVGQGSTAAP